MNKEKESIIYTLQKSIEKEMETREPIRKGCWAAANGGCNCTGDCQEIVGWRDKNPSPFNRLPNGDINKNEESHFEDIEPINTCRHIGHNPPTHLHIPHGKRYIHICPGCKNRVVLQPPQITF